MAERRCITICGWCPTELPNGDHFERRHHFLTAHGIRNDSHSVRFVYPDDIGDEFERWQIRSAAITKEQQR